MCSNVSVPDTGAVTNETVYASYTATESQAYDTFGNITNRIDVAGYGVQSRSSSEGLTLTVSGTEYPVEYGYNALGSRTSLKTYRTAAGDFTYWNYDRQSGLLTSKIYTDGSFVAYGYTPSGQLARKTWARHAWVENGYDGVGRLSGVTYSDTVTPAVYYQYNDFNLVTEAGSSEAAYTYGYNTENSLVSEAVVSGGITSQLARTVDRWQRPESVTLAQGTNTVATVYDYNAVGEIRTVVFTNAVGQTTRAEYIRTNGWNCGYVLTLSNGSAIIRTLERDWERPQLVTRVLTTFNGNTIRDYQYAYDILGRITNRIDNGVQMNTFNYNARSEVLYALFGANETTYAYDDIGNHDLYPANNLNQYVDNTIAYDADGNMTRRGTWKFGWDAENRLLSADDGTTSITNAYDYKHRRVRKTVGSESHTFVYDGWNLLAETINDTERTHYFWGLDLSDSLQGTGGVGGLLAVSQSGTMYYPVYDNNGNITAYLDDSGNIVASYGYNAFGETISQSGSRANEFAFRFSTKYHDNETGLYYYGYRFYSPVLRTWLNRDPIEEEGGLNLYGFCENDPVTTVDKLGMFRLARVNSSPRVSLESDGKSMKSFWMGVFVLLDKKEKSLLANSSGVLVHGKHVEIKLRNCSGGRVVDEVQTTQSTAAIDSQGRTKLSWGMSNGEVAAAYYNVASLSGYGKCVQGSITIKSTWFLQMKNGSRNGIGGTDISGSTDTLHGVSPIKGWPSAKDAVSFGSLSVKISFSCRDGFFLDVTGRGSWDHGYYNRSGRDENVGVPYAETW